MEWSLDAPFRTWKLFDTFLLQDKQRFGELYRENFLLLFTPHNLTPFSWKNDIKMSSFSMAQDA